MFGVERENAVAAIVKKIKEEILANKRRPTVVRVLKGIGLTALEELDHLPAWAKEYEEFFKQ